MNTNKVSHSQAKGNDKGTQKPQRSIIYLELFREPQNTKMLHLKTGISREAICRRKRELEDLNLLWVLKLDYCPITGKLVQFLTTNLQTYQRWIEQNKRG
jgi:hypothetical protein